MPLQQFCQVAFLVGVEMCDDDKGHPRIPRERLEERLQGSQAARGGAEAYDG
jgi:hypothetical protein